MVYTRVSKMKLPTIHVCVWLTPALLTYINCVNVKLAAQGQAVFLSLTVLVLSAISVTGLVHIAQGNSRLQTDQSDCSIPWFEQLQILRTQKNVEGWSVFK